MVNVGAGAGSYEPADRPVVAVEPSLVMASQRPAGAGPVVRAVAEAMPFADGAFGAAMGVLTVHHYFPATGRLEASRETPPAELGQLLGRRLTVTPVPIPSDCTDGFNGAYWRRPAAYLDPDSWQAMSALALIPAADRDEGMRHLRADLDGGEWARRFGYLLALDGLDLGYRVIAARR